jgi:hypothetical protein
MRLPYRAFLIGTALIALCPSFALAGMPSIRLTDMARMRIQAISFFLAAFLVSAAVIQFLWNRLGKDFSVLPRLSYGKALGIVVLWGMLFVLVLTMISGARELMTPGAWQKDGFTYRLADKAPVETSTDSARHKKVESLRAALWKYAERHKGHFPTRRNAPGIAKEQWQTADPSGIRYLYVGGSVTTLPAKPLAYEPEVYGGYRLVLFTNGEIRSMEWDELAQALPAEKQ